MESTNEIKPIGKRCLIQIEQSANKSASGLILNQDQNNISTAPVIGTVLNKGSESIFEIGDKLLFRRYGVDELKFITESGEQKVFIIEDEEVLAIIK